MKYIHSVQSFTQFTLRTLHLRKLSLHPSRSGSPIPRPGNLPSLKCGGGRGWDGGRSGITGGCELHGNAGFEPRSFGRAASAVTAEPSLQSHFCDYLADLCLPTGVCEWLRSPHPQYQPQHLEFSECFKQICKRTHHLPHCWLFNFFHYLSIMLMLTEGDKVCGDCVMKHNHSTTYLPFINTQEMPSALPAISSRKQDERLPI